jgi:transcriptional regulator with XRE-family HTH domain
MMQAQRSLKDIRKSQGLTQVELAERAGIARTTGVNCSHLLRFRRSHQIPS